MKSDIFKAFLLCVCFSFVFAACSRKDVSSIMLNEDFQYLGIKDTLYLTTIIEAPENKDYVVIWRSTNNNVATVSANGIVEAKSEGTAIITAEAGKETARCEIHVVTYKFDGISTYLKEDGDIPAYSMRLLKNRDVYVERGDMPDGNVLLQLDIFTSSDVSDLFRGSYQVTDIHTPKEYSFLKGEIDNEGYMTGSFLEDKLVFNSQYLLSGGKVDITNLNEQYIIKGDITVEDLSGNNKSISFIYTGEIRLKSNLIEIL